MRWFSRSLLMVAALFVAGSASATTIPVGAIVTNTTGGTTSFSITFPNNPGTPILETVAALIQGSVATTLTDNNGDGATLTADVFYSAVIDNVEVKQLLSPINIAVGAFASDAVFENFGPEPINPPIQGPGFAQVVIEFTLSAGDTAAFSGVFNVVPEPSTVILFGSGLAGLIAMGHRRRA